MFIYHADGQEFDTLDELIDYLKDEYQGDSDDFDAYLNDEVGTIEIYGFSFSPADVLCQMDGDEYNEAFSDWSANEAENMADNLRYDLTHYGHDGYETWDFGMRITMTEIPDDEDEEEEDEPDPGSEENDYLAMVQIFTK